MADLASLPSRFDELFGDSNGVRLALAPGRINLIGEHTDYNEGWALPMAIDRHVGLAFRARSDRRLRVHACAFDETRTVELDALAPGAHRGWLAYVAGTAWALEQSGLELRGLDCVIDAELPVAAGLSSSAALEMVVARALCAAAEVEWRRESPAEMARLCQIAENRYVGVASGRMDQLAVGCAKRGHALLIDFRSLEARPVPLPDAVKVVVMDTGVRRSLSDGAYNERRASCEEAVELLETVNPEVRALRDADSELLAAARARMPERVYRRARHVVEESRRPVEMAASLADGDPIRAGELMNASHASLRDLYEVSSPELDRITELAREQPGCFGARLTGAGFGGCAVALVAAERAEAFADRVARAYVAELALPAEVFVSAAATGVRLAEDASAKARLRRVGE